MILSLRRRRASRRPSNTNTQISDSDSGMEIVIPNHFRCPISLDLMKDPVTLLTGITYDRESIEKWIEAGNQTCPVTNQVLNSFDQIPNHSIRRMIQDWCVQNRSHGIERIPTPRIPVAPFEVSAICEKIAVATRRGDRKRCQDLVAKIKVWGKESERDRRCIVKSGAGCVLSLSFESFARGYDVVSNGEESLVLLLDQILSVLTWAFDPSDGEAQAQLGSDSSLRCLVSFLDGNDLSARQNAVLVLKTLLSLDQRHVVAANLAEIEGALEGLVGIIRQPVSPKATKASLTVIFHMISENCHSQNDINKIGSRFLDLGLVSLLLENVLDGEKSLSERALRVLDVICDCKEGRERAYENALTTPLLVKKILRISDMATEILVSILWKLCKNSSNEEKESVLVEALQVGAFQKLLLLLQMGTCCERMKEKVTELLKLFNLHRRGLDCVDSSGDFKYLKKPF
ncbi:Coatomer beta subunit [Parasponia andersonii]|uniref:U-box domain-containing protein n=1 Tax=Parasponia andersonii TaxID=3476 RepID=A0A2P5B3P1_PARAD|nr:Coatomer beta subunit [Parasponia andersonii]